MQCNKQAKNLSGLHTNPWFLQIVRRGSAWGKSEIQVCILCILHQQANQDRFSHDDDKGQQDG